MSETVTETGAASATPAETTQAGAGTTQPDAASGLTTLLTGDGQANQEGETATNDQKAEDKPAEGSEEKPVVPEAYEFTFPEGVTVDPDTLGGLSELAKELGLTQEQAQKVADLGAKQSERWDAAMAETMKATEQGWLDAVKTDKEYGGDKLAENLSVAKAAIDQFATPEFKDFLKESRLGNHPEMIRLMHRVGKTIANDSVVPGGRNTNQIDIAAKYYPNSNHT